MSKPRVSVVLLDLDNTLWDWQEIWYRSFRAMLDEIVRISGIPEEELHGPISEVHKKHGTSEYAFLLGELDLLKEKHPGEDLTKVYASAIKAFREARRSALQLYPSVFETLWAFRDAGCLVIGYTESQAYYTNYRMRRLGLDGLLDYLYSPADHDLPEGMTREQIRHYRADTYQLKRTVHRHTPPGELKPNPAVLNSILKDVGALPEDSIFIGDSQMKDIAMAQACAVKDVWAKYGVAQHRPEYSLIRAVTHWTPEVVAREKKIAEEGADIASTYVLDHSFSQVLALFDFVPFKKEVSPDDLPHVIEVWKKTVDVQQHFNDLELRIRNFAISLLVAVVGAAALVTKENIAIRVGLIPALLLGLGWLAAIEINLRSKEPSKKRRYWSLVVAMLAAVAAILVRVLFDGPILNVPVGSVIIAAGAVGWLAFYFMDKYWYHRLLYGAVKEGVELEKVITARIPTRGLTGKIGDLSPFEFRGYEVHSDRKMNWFYLSILVLLGLMLVGSFLSYPSTSVKTTRHNVTFDSIPSSLRSVTVTTTDMTRDTAQAAPAQTTATSKPAPEPPAPTDTTLPSTTTRE